jgi:hypothetical protein
MANQNKKGEALPAIEHVLEALKDRRKRLDDADTQISNLIKDIETELQAHVNTRVWTDMTDAGGPETVLAFGKHDSKWQLLIEMEFPDGTGNTTPLLSCSREARVRVFAEGYIEALVRGAVAQLDKQLAVRENAISKATDLVRALGGIPF